MWEFSVFRRLFPAIVAVIFGIVMYLGVKYVVSGWYDYGYCATTDPAYLNPNNWGLAAYIFPLLAIWTAFCFAILAWEIITGRRSLGGGEGGGRRTRRRPPTPPTSTPIFPFIRRE